MSVGAGCLPAVTLSTAVTRACASCTWSFENLGWFFWSFLSCAETPVGLTRNRAARRTLHTLSARARICMTTLLPVCVEMTNLSDHNRACSAKVKESGLAPTACGRGSHGIIGVPRRSPLPLLDVSLRLSPELPCYPGNPAFELQPVKRIARGDSSNVSALNLGTHTGTHVDAPRHFSRTAVRAPTSCRWTCWWAPRGSCTSRASAPSRLANCKTSTCGVSPGCSSGPTTRPAGRRRSRFNPDFVYLADDGARLLVERGIRLVGSRLPLGRTIQGAGGADAPRPPRSTAWWSWKGSTSRRRSRATTNCCASR